MLFVRIFLFLVFSRYLHFAALLTMLTMALYLEYKNKISRRRYTAKNDITDVILRQKKTWKNKKLRMPAMKTMAVGTYNRYRSEQMQDIGMRDE